MNDTIRYNLFIFLSVISRNLISIFSLVFLYSYGYTIKDIFLFLTVMYGVGIISNTLGIYLSSKISFKYVLIISSIINILGYYYLSVMNRDLFSLIILSIIMSFGDCLYNSVRHYVAISIKDIKVNNILIWNYIGIMFTSVISAYITKNISILFGVIVSFIISLISIIPLYKIKSCSKGNVTFKDISIKDKKYFFVLEQFKVVFCELQNLFLFLYIDNNLMYIGGFQVVIGIASIIFLFYFNRKIDYKYFKYFNFILCIVLLLKLNVDNKYIMYAIALFEGLCLKEYEYFSTVNLYDVSNNNIFGYLIICEIIFGVSKFLILIFSYFFVSNLYVFMMICILFIFISGFVYPKKLDKNLFT